MISVIIPVYNVASYLRDCLDSVVNQTYRDWEGILIDDGSTDDSGAICDEYESMDPRFRVIHQSNQGIIAVRNTGLKEAQGEYLAWVDSDDVVHPKWLETMYRIITTNKCDVAAVGHVHCRNDQIHIDDEARINEARFVPIDQVVDQLIYSTPQGISCSLCNKLFCKDIVEDSLFYIDKAEDLDFNIQMAVKGARYYFTDTPLYFYRIRKGSITDGASRAFMLETPIIRCDIYDHYLTLDPSLKYKSKLLESIYQHVLCAKNDEIYNNVPALPSDEVYYQEVYRRTLTEFKASKNVSREIKVKIMLLHHLPWLYYILVKVKKVLYRY